MSEDENENLVISSNINNKPKINNKRKLSFYEELKTGPLEKFYYHGIFPWKLTFTILLVIFTICQSVMILSRITSFHRAHIRALYNLFIDDSDKSNLDYNRVVYLYTIQDLKSHISSSINNYYNINSLTLDPVEFPEDNDSPVAEFQYLDNTIIKEKSNKYNNTNSNNLPNFFHPINNSLSFINKRKFYYRLNHTSLGPFNYDDERLKQFLNDVRDFKINYTMSVKYPYLYSDNFECNKWTVVQVYTFQSRAHFICSIDISIEKCKQDTQIISWFENFMNKLLWVHILVIISATFSLYFALDSMYTLIKMYMEARNRLKKKKEEKEKKKMKIIISSDKSDSSEESHYYNPLFETTSEEEDEEEHVNEKEKNNKFVKNINTNKEKLSNKIDESKQILSNPLPGVNKVKAKKIKAKKHFQFLQFWSIFIITGNILQIFGSCLALSNSNEVTTVIAVLVGSGCLFACLSTGKYIEYQPDYSTIYETLKLSFPIIIRYLIGVFPIFLGFLFLGICLFWRSERFTSSASASYTLFALIQGDAVYDIFTDLTQVGFFIGQVYCYVFCITFIIIVFNIFVSIIENTYVVTKIKNKTSWVMNYVQLEPKLVDIKLHSRPSLEITKQYFKKMEKTSEMLKKRLSKSLKSKDLLSWKNKSFDDNSFEEKFRAKSTSKSLFKLKEKELNQSGSFNQKQSHMPKSFTRGNNLNVLPESIPEKDEFELNAGASRKVSISYERKKLEDHFKNIENKFERIKFLALQIKSEKKSEKLKRKSYLNFIDNNLTKYSIKETMINKINSVENKTKDLREVWMRNH